MYPRQGFVPVMEERNQSIPSRSTICRHWMTRVTAAADSARCTPDRIIKKGNLPAHCVSAIKISQHGGVVDSAGKAAVT